MDVEPLAERVVIDELLALDLVHRRVDDLDNLVRVAGFGLERRFVEGEGA